MHTSLTVTLLIVCALHLIVCAPSPSLMKELKNLYEAEVDEISVRDELTKDSAVRRADPQAENRPLRPGEGYDPCEFEGTFREYGEKFEVVDKVLKCRKTCYCQGSTIGVFCHPCKA
ncbi:uncharacterized protein LOC106152389 [Lingula anatina]|uniref:Uncharacterized protein LOC106152389 n=1 Tax=Lingula anatina TaxID=7574 RepID=A0A1S3H7D3_LINAN|nr:uncharacterized protein LOC106152389 [Lingula anatina]|eukprot:XP_013381396.1 uncharacterized protein LOC106152389 [Lingula anatina]